MAAKKINLKQLSESSGINYTQIGRYFELTTDITLATLLKMCKGLGCSISEVVNYQSNVKDFEQMLKEVHDMLKDMQNTLSQKPANN